MTCFAGNMEGGASAIASALPLDPRSMVELKMQELQFQILQLRQLLAVQVESTGSNPLEEDLVALAKGTKRVGRWDTLSATAVETLAGVYGLKDFLSKSEIQELCVLVGTTPSQVKAFFADLRKIARDELSGPEKKSKVGKLVHLNGKSKSLPSPTLEGTARRLGRAANGVRRSRLQSGLDSAEPSTSEAGGAAEESRQLLRVGSIRKKSFTSDVTTRVDTEHDSDEDHSQIGVRVLELLSKSSCLPKHWDKPDTDLWSGDWKGLLSEMKITASVLGRERLSGAICGLPQAALSGLCSEGTVKYLVKWVQEALLDEQTTLLRHLQKALELLPLETAPPADIALASSVLQALCKYRVPDVAGGAAVLLQRICPQSQKVAHGVGLFVAGRKHSRLVDEDDRLRKKLKNGSTVSLEKRGIRGYPNELNGQQYPIMKLSVTQRTGLGLERDSGRGEGAAVPGRGLLARAPSFKVSRRGAQTERRSIQFFSNASLASSTFAEQQRLERALSSRTTPMSADTGSGAVAAVGNSQKPLSADDVRRDRDGAEALDWGGASSGGLGRGDSDLTSRFGKIQRLAKQPSSAPAVARRVQTVALNTAKTVTLGQTGEGTVRDGEMVRAAAVDLARLCPAVPWRLPPRACVPSELALGEESTEKDRVFTDLPEDADVADPATYVVPEIQLEAEPDDSDKEQEGTPHEQGFADLPATFADVAGSLTPTVSPSVLKGWAVEKGRGVEQQSAEVPAGMEVKPSLSNLTSGSSHGLSLQGPVAETCGVVSGSASTDTCWRTGSQGTGLAGVAQGLGAQSGSPAVSGLGLVAPQGEGKGEGVGAREDIQLLMEMLPASEESEELVLQGMRGEGPCAAIAELGRATGKLLLMFLREKRQRVEGGAARQAGAPVATRSPQQLPHQQIVHCQQQPGGLPEVGGRAGHGGMEAVLPQVPWGGQAGAPVATRLTEQMTHQQSAHRQQQPGGLLPEVGGQVWGGAEPAITPQLPHAHLHAAMVTRGDFCDGPAVVSGGEIVEDLQRSRYDEGARVNNNSHGREFQAPTGATGGRMAPSTSFEEFLIQEIQAKKASKEVKQQQVMEAGPASSVQIIPSIERIHPSDAFAQGASPRHDSLPNTLPGHPVIFAGALAPPLPPPVHLPYEHPRFGPRLISMVERPRGSRPFVQPPPFVREGQPFLGAVACPGQSLVGAFPGQRRSDIHPSHEVQMQPPPRKHHNGNKSPDYGRRNIKRLDSPERYGRSVRFH